MGISEIKNVMYTIDANVTVPFGGIALNNIGENAQYLFYSNIDKDQTMDSNAVENLQASAIIYAKKMNAIAIGTTYIITLPENAIKDYFDAGAGFFSDENMLHPLTKDNISNAFASGKIYLNKDIIINNGPNPAYNIITVYDLNSPVSGGGYKCIKVFWEDFSSNYYTYTLYKDATKSEANTYTGTQEVGDLPYGTAEVYIELPIVYHYIDLSDDSKEKDISAISTVYDLLYYGVFYKDENKAEAYEDADEVWDALTDDNDATKVYYAQNPPAPQYTVYIDGMDFQMPLDGIQSYFDGDMYDAYDGPNKETATQYTQWSDVESAILNGTGNVYFISRT